MAQFLPFLLFLHVMGAILAFGPTFAYSIMGAMAGREPQHANFSARQVAAIGNKLVYPLAIFQGVTGVLLIIASGRDLVTRALAGPRDRPVRDHAHLRADGPAERPAPPDRDDLDASGARLARRTPRSRRRSRRSSAAGCSMGLSIVIIVFLMVVKPTF